MTTNNTTEPSIHLNQKENITFDDVEKKIDSILTKIIKK